MIISPDNTRYIIISSLTLSVLMHISHTIHCNAGHNYKIIIQELKNLLHGKIRFLPGRISSLTLSVLMPSVLTITNNCTCTCTCFGTRGGRSTCSGTMNFNEFCSWEV